MDFSNLTISDNISIVGSIITIISMGLSIIGAICARKSKDKAEDYYKKAKDVAKFANTNISYIECKKIMKKFRELLCLVNPEDKEIRGINIKKTVEEYGIEISDSISKIREIVSSKECTEVNILLNDSDIDVDRYISSLITGSVLIQGDFIDNDDFYKCKRKFDELQELIKKQGEKLEAKLK